MDESIQKTSLDIHSAGKNCQLRFGDLTGDGRMDILLVRADAVSDERFFPHRIVCATAFSVDGEMLWQIGDAEYPSPNVKCDIPAQIYDIDHDGKNEVIIIMDNELLILDGKTAEVKKSTQLPDTSACDSITIADLDGTGYAQNILIKNKYSQIWAFDINLNILWTYQGNLGHTPAVFDINGDGIEEIIAGYNVISGSGELLWSISAPQHADSVCICHFGKYPEPVILFAGRLIYAYSASGTLLWTLPEEAQKIAVGKFRDNVSENEILLLNKMSLFDCDGNFISEKNDVVFMPCVVCNFDGSNKNFIAAHKKDDIFTTVCDGFMRPVYTLDALGKIACCDFLGDGISQIVIYGDDVLHIFSAAPTDFTAPSRTYARPQPRQYYNTSIFNILPFSQYTSGYIAEDFAAQNIIKWAENYADINMQNSFVKITRSEFILLLVTILNLKQDFEDNFADISPDDSFYTAVGTAKALGIVSGDDNMFLPNSTVTVAYANAVLEKLNLSKSFNFDSMYELSKQDLARLILSLTGEG